MYNKDKKMRHLNHIQSWSLQSFNTMEGASCGFVYNIDIKQPRRYKPEVS